MELTTLVSQLLALLSTTTTTYSVRTFAHRRRQALSSEYWPFEQMQSHDRIVGGTNATEVFPYMVSLKYKNLHDCGGAIVTELKILTAAHCTTDKIMALWTAWVGASHLHEGVGHQVMYAYAHPNFDSKTLFNDIAVLTVYRRFDFSNPLIQPIRISKRELNIGETVMGMGWGRVMYEPPQRTFKLQLLYQTTISNAQCSIIWKTEIIESQFCSINMSRTCLGDSGGPIVTVETIEPQLVGVVSYGPVGCKVRVPNVRTRISNYLNFIGAALYGF